MEWQPGIPQWIVIAVALQRVCELVLARRNTARLMASGAVEHGRSHYPLFVLLHVAWLLALYVLVPASASINGWLLGAFVLLQLARVWIIVTLRGFWTTRVITVPDAPLIVRGPYRWFRHPNYTVVACEIAVLPLVFDAWQIAFAFTVLNAPLLWWRIRIEDAALSSRRENAVS